MTELEMRTANNILRVMKEIDERECKQAEEQSASNEEKCEVEC